MELIDPETWQRTSPAAYASQLFEQYEDAAWIIPYLSERISTSAHETRFSRDVLRELNQTELIDTEATPEAVALALLDHVENPIETLFGLLKQMEASEVAPPKELLLQSLKRVKNEIIEGLS